MKLLIRKAKIVDPTSPHHHQAIDILISQGKIQKIGHDLEAAGAKEFSAPNIHVSPGWVDMYASIGDPGFEHRESFDSAEEAAAAGGFTAVAVKPDTNPPIDSKSGVEYILKKGAGRMVDFLPLGCISQKREGTDIAELLDMQASGAVAFSDGDKTVADSGLLLRSLQYVKRFDGVIFNRPEDQHLKAEAVNEGPISIKMGLKGTPALAESLMVQRDLKLAAYADSRLHFVKISTAESIKWIREAKRKGLKVTASVAAYHLLLPEEEVMEFDSNYKLWPPLRAREDQKTMVAALADGTIDCIVSDHNPLEEELKKVEFEYAEPGMINWQTAFAAANTAAKAKLHIELLVDKLAVQPRKILKLDVPQITEGAIANLTIFDPDKRWEFTEEANLSLSKNSPFFGKTLTGKVLGIVNQKQTNLWRPQTTH